MNRNERYDAIVEIREMVGNDMFMSALTEYLTEQDIEGIRDYCGIEANEEEEAEEAEEEDDLDGYEDGEPSEDEGDE